MLLKSKEQIVVIVQIVVIIINVGSAYSNKCLIIQTVF